ncbi:hypothetical protein DFQ30_001971, partial [Apophysomyces sp. BC1015]
MARVKRGFKRLDPLAQLVNVAQQRRAPVPVTMRYGRKCARVDARLEQRLRHAGFRGHDHTVRQRHVAGDADCAADHAATANRRAAGNARAAGDHRVGTDSA